MFICFFNHVHYFLLFLFWHDHVLYTRQLHDKYRISICILYTSYKIYGYIYQAWRQHRNTCNYYVMIITNTMSIYRYTMVEYTYSLILLLLHCTTSYNIIIYIYLLTHYIVIYIQNKLLILITYIVSIIYTILVSNCCNTYLSNIHSNNNNNI